MKRSTGSKNRPQSTGKKNKVRDICWPQAKTKRSSNKKQTKQSRSTNKQNHNQAKIIFPKQKSQTQPNQLKSRNLLILNEVFQEAVDRVFRSLDIFANGKICSINITRNIPEPILYFLGSLFQKLRESRQNMSRKDFFHQCLKIKDKSNPQDIKQFIFSTKNVKIYCSEKKSLESSQLEQQKHNRNYRVVTLNTLNTLQTLQNEAKTIYQQAQQDIASQESLNFLKKLKKQGNHIHQNVREQIQNFKKDKFRQLDSFMKKGIQKTFKGFRQSKKTSKMATIDYSNSPRKTIDSFLKNNYYDRPLKMLPSKEKNPIIAKRINQSTHHQVPLKKVQNRVFQRRKDEIYIKQSHKLLRSQIDSQIQQSKQRIKYLQSLKTIQYSQEDSDHHMMNQFMKSQKHRQQSIKQNLKGKDCLSKDFNCVLTQSPNFNYPLKRKSVESNANDSAKIMRLSEKLDGYIKSNAQRIQRSKYILQDLI